jgi:hypothetical protein
MSVRPKASHGLSVRGGDGEAPGVAAALAQGRRPLPIEKRRLAVLNIRAYNKPLLLSCWLARQQEKAPSC